MVSWFVTGLCACTALATHSALDWVTRDKTQLRLNGQRFTTGGANVYWLGLDENVLSPAGQPYYAPTHASYPTHGRITEIMNILNTMGATTIRSQTLGVSVGNPLSVMPSLGEFNEEAFDTIDWAVYEAGRHGLRIFAPLTDNYDYYHGGKFDFLRFRGFNLTFQTSGNQNPEVQQFYTNATIVSDFKAYIKHLITHKNKYNGLTYAEDPTIFAYETGNELSGPVFGDKDVPVSWTTEIAEYIKQLAPRKLVIDGTYGINKTHLPISAVDIYSDHFYPRSLTQLQNDIGAVKAANKAYVVGEYAWNSYNYGNPLPTSTPSLSTFLSAIENATLASTPGCTGDLFWSLFGHNVPNCNQFVNHTDGFTLQYGNPTNTAQNNTDIATIRQHLFKLRGKSVGTNLSPVPCPGPT